MAKAFIFSIDAFVAFTLSLVAIYSLIFFSSLPSANYALLTQTHYLAKDGLQTLSMTQCQDELCKDNTASVLDNIVFFMDENEQFLITRQYLNNIIPAQFGYKLESSEGDNWKEVYDSSKDSDSANKHIGVQPKRVSVSSYTVVFNVNAPETKNPYLYKTCHGNKKPCGIPKADSDQATGAEVKSVKLTVYN